VQEETAEPIVDLLNRGVSIAATAAREGLTAGRSRPEMAPQRFEKIGSGLGNGMGSPTPNPQDLVRRGLAACDSGWRAGRMTKLQKKAPNALKSPDAELKSAPVPLERYGEFIR
jgi:hypothetical protein